MKLSPKDLVIITLSIIILLIVGCYIKQNYIDGVGDSAAKCLTHEKKCAKEYVGLYMDDAFSKAHGAGMSSVIYKIDGKVQKNNIGYSGPPIFFVIEKEYVTKVYFGQDVPDIEDVLLFVNGIENLAQ